MCLEVYDIVPLRSRNGSHRYREMEITDIITHIEMEVTDIAPLRSRNARALTFQNLYQAINGSEHSSHRPSVVLQV
jgi:hypothetical protein